MCFILSTVLFEAFYTPVNIYCNVCKHMQEPITQAQTKSESAG